MCFHGSFCLNIAGRAIAIYFLWFKFSLSWISGEKLIAAKVAYGLVIIIANEESLTHPGSTKGSGHPGSTKGSGHPGSTKGSGHPGSTKGSGYCSIYQGHGVFEAKGTPCLVRRSCTPDSVKFNID